MPWTHFTEIRAWQLSMQLEKEFSAILARPPACLDFKFCNDAKDAAASAARNIAEGFGRRGNREFLRFMNIAHGSQCETQTNLMIARNRQYISEDEFNHLWTVSQEMIKTTVGLINWLRG